MKGKNVGLMPDPSWVAVQASGVQHRMTRFHGRLARFYFADEVSDILENAGRLINIITDRFVLS